MRDESKILAIMERHNESGLTIRDFCSNEGIAPATFYNWKKKLRDNKEKRFIPIEIKNPPSFATRPKINQCGHEDQQATNEYLLEISYPNGTVLRVKNDLDLLHLKALVNLLN